MSENRITKDMNQQLIADIKQLKNHRTDKLEARILTAMKDNEFLLPIMPSEADKKILEKEQKVTENMSTNIPVININDNSKDVAYLLFNNLESFNNFFKNDPNVYVMTCTVEKLLQVIDYTSKNDSNLKDKNINIVWDYQTLDLILSYENLLAIMHPEVLEENVQNVQNVQNVENVENVQQGIKREEYKEGDQINLLDFSHIDAQLLKQLKKYMKHQKIVKKAYVFIDKNHTNEKQSKVIFYFDIGLEINPKENSREIINDLAQQEFIPKGTELDFIAYPEDFNALFEEENVKPFYKRNLIFY